MPNLDNQPKLWLRYMDDIFALVEKDFNHDLFLTKLNSLSRTIQFTYELEVDNRLPFLDCLVIHELSNFQFDVYRKPSNAGMYLHFYSWHPLHVKRSVLFSLLLKAYRICDNKYRSNELDRLYENFRKLRYPFNFVEKVHRDVKRKFYSSSVSRDEPQNERKCNLTLPYNQLTKSIIRPILGSRNCSLTYRASNTIRSNLITTRPGTNVDEASGIYSIPCNDCDKMYIGQTGRNLKERLNEHVSSMKKCDTNNALFRHTLEQNHKVTLLEAKMVYKCSDWAKRVIVESAIIGEVSNFNMCRGDRNIDITSRKILLNNLDKLKLSFPNR